MSRLRRVALVVGVSVAALVPLAGPASAAGGLSVTLTSPAAASNSSAITVAGSVSGSGNSINLTSTIVEEIKMEITPEAGGQPLVVFSSAVPAPASPPIRFSAQANLPRNGNYRLVVTAKGTANKQTVLLASPVDGSATKSFAVAVAPKAPQGVAAKVNDDRSVTVSWTANTEPDLIGYQVFRSDPGGVDYFQVSPPQGVAPASCSSKCTFTDSAILGGGDYRYQVLAFRPNPADATKPIASTASRTTSASVPEPTPTTAGALDGVPGVPGGPGTTAAPAVGSVRGPAISSFLASRPAPKPPPAPKILEAPDTGFRQDLPFGARPPADDVEPGGDQLAAEPPADAPVLGGENTSQTRPLVPVAAGLILVLLAGHLRLLMKRSRAVPVGAPRRRPGGSVVVSPRPRRERIRRVADPRTVVPFPDPMPGAQTVTVFREEPDGMSPAGAVPTLFDAADDDIDFAEQVRLVDAAFVRPADRSSLPAPDRSDDDVWDDALVYEVVSPGAR